LVQSDFSGWEYTLLILGIDGSSLLSAKTGIGIYTDRLLRGISSCRDFAVKIYLPMPFINPSKRNKSIDMLRKDYSGIEIKAHAVPTPKVQRWIWGRSNFLPIERFLGPVDLYHGTSFVMPPLQGAKGVMTIYDLSFMLFPTFHTRETQAFSKSVRRFAERADCIIAISEQTKQDIVRLLNIPENKVRVTLLAADTRYRVIDDTRRVASVAADYGIDREYILYTGTLEPRKNIPAIIRAFQSIKRELNIPHRLVLAGKKGWLYDDIFAEVRALDLEQEVIFTGYVPDEDLPFLYNGADLFVYPSFYEGFGLPPLEAMACGCPVVSSNTSSLPEVVGTAGIMVDPRKPEELATAMARVLGDSELARDMRRRGVERAAIFNWDRCVQETLSIYRDVTGK
jgi:glycosyltransferase involved in cell wall biosynthesis